MLDTRGTVVTVAMTYTVATAVTPGTGRMTSTAVTVHMRIT